MPVITPKNDDKKLVHYTEILRENLRKLRLLNNDGCIAIPPLTQPHAVVQGHINDFTNKPLVLFAHFEATTLNPQSPNMKQQFDELLDALFRASHHKMKNDFTLSLPNHTPKALLHVPPNKNESKVPPSLNAMLLDPLEMLQFVNHFVWEKLGGALTILQGNEIEAFVLRAEFQANKIWQAPVIPLETHIKRGKGVCRHRALLAAYLIDCLIQSNLLPPGNVFIDQQMLSPSSAHAYVIYRHDKTKKLYLIDPMWHKVVDITNGKNIIEMRYPAALKEKVIAGFYNKHDATLSSQPSTYANLVTALCADSKVIFDTTPSEEKLAWSFSTNRISESLHLFDTPEQPAYHNDETDTAAASPARSGRRFEASDAKYADQDSFDSLFQSNILFYLLQGTSFANTNSSCDNFLEANLRLWESQLLLGSQSDYVAAANTPEFYSRYIDTKLVRQFKPKHIDIGSNEMKRVVTDMAHSQHVVPNIK